MCEYVNGLVVEVEEATQTAAPALQGPVAGEHVRVELQVLRHVPPVQQLHAARLGPHAPALASTTPIVLSRVQLRPLLLLIITDML